MPSQITMAYGQTLRKLGPSMQRRIILELCTVERIQDKIFQAILLTMKKLKRKNYQWIIFVCGMKLMIVHGKKTKEVRMRTMTMGVMMSMDVVDHGRELGMGATIFLE